MRPVSSFYQPFQRSLTRQVDRLRDTLHHLSYRLRETVVHAAGQAVGAAVREAFRSILLHSGRYRDEHEDLYRPPGHAPGFWSSTDELDREPMYDDLDERLLDDEPNAIESEHETDELPRPARLHTALAAGCQVAAWSLRSMQSGKMTTAIGAGLLTALAAYVGGPFLAAGTGLVGSFLSLLSLDAGLRASAARLPGFFAR